MRRGPDTGSSLHAPVRTRQEVIGQRRAFEDTAFRTCPRLRVDMIWDFAGKYASGIGEGIALRTTGTPTAIAQVANSANGEVSIALAATSEAEFNGLDWTDELNIPATSRPMFEAYLKTSALALTSVQEFTAGLSQAYNATLNSIAKYVRFRMSGSNVLLYEGKDGTTTSNANSTGITLDPATYYLFTIEQKQPGQYVFFLEDAQVGQLALNAFAATDLLQPLLGIGKASGTTVPAILADYVRVQWDRRL